jgi:hypothetical protein
MRMVNLLSILTAYMNKKRSGTNPIRFPLKETG